jgi:glycosyltransferase involved in cell wall biosynthesis
MRVAIVHYWLVNMRGGERVVDALCRLLPGADIFTLFYDPAKVTPTIRGRTVKASFLNPLRKHYRSLLALAPFALESFDLRPYDLVISSESGPAKGVLTSAGARHVCYCHSPMRYLWELYPAYLHDWTRSPLKRVALTALSCPLRIWDQSTAARVDQFIANSANVQRRIWKTYRRDSRVIYPPVQVEEFYWRPAQDYYLVVSELVSYKRVEDAVRCFSRTGRKLKIVGDGPEYAALKRLAASNIEFCGHVSQFEIRELYARCRALLMPGEEDFGMVTVEAMASGKPVIALGRGGVLEAIPTQPRGAVLYSAPGDSGLTDAIRVFEKTEQYVSPKELQDWAAHFSEARFRDEMREALDLPATSAQPAAVARGALQ